MSEPSRPRRARRILKIILVVLLVVVIAVVGTVAFVLSHLETSSVKTRLQALVKKATGIELDYDAAQATITSGLHLRNLRIKTGGSLRSVEPELVRVGSLDVTWGLRRLASASVDGVVVDNVSITIVLDDDGRTSFDFEPPEATKAVAKKAVEKRSRSIAALLETAVPLHGATVGPIRVMVEKTHDGVRYDRVELTGLHLTAQHDGGKTTVSFGQRDQPLALSVTERSKLRNLAVQPTLWLEAVVYQAEIAIHLDLHAGTQSLVAGLDHALSLDASLRAEPKRGQLSVAISRLELADGTALGKGELELPDDDDSGKKTRPPLLVRADAHIDADKLLALVPPTLVSKDVLTELPHVKKGALTLSAAQLELTAAPRVLEGGHLSLVGTLEDVRAKLPAAEVVAPRLQLDVRSGVDRHIDAAIDARLDSLHYADDKTNANVTDAHLEVTAKALELDPTHRGGAFDVSLHASHIDAVAGGASVAFSGALITVKGSVPSTPPYGATVALDIDRVSVTQGGKRLANDPLTAHLRLSDIQPDGTRATVKGDLALGALALNVDASKSAGLVDYDLAANAPTLALLAPIVSGIDVPWSNVGLVMRSKGRVNTHGKAPYIEHATHLELAHISVRGPAGTIAAKGIALDVASQGTPKVHQGTLSLAFTGLRRDDTSFGDGKIAGSAKLDIDAPKIELDLKSEGTGTPGVDVHAKFGFDRKARRLAFDLDLVLKRLGALAPLAGKAGAQIDLDKLELDVKGKGEMSGLVDDLALGGKLRLASDPFLATGNVKLAAHVRSVEWQLGAQALTSPDVSWVGELRATHDRRSLTGDVSVDDLNAAIGATSFGIKHIGDHLSIELDGDPHKLQLTLVDTVQVRGVSQALSGSYALQDITLDVRASGTKEGVIRVPLLRFENRAAGTVVELHGGLDLSEDRRSLAFRGNLKQDLAKLWQDKSLFVGTGVMDTELGVRSGDLHRFDIQTSLRLQNVSVELPREKIKVENVDGEIPVSVEIVGDPNGARLVHLAHDNSYSELRFADQHPMFSQHSFLTISRIETPWVIVSPFAGNMSINDNILSVSQLELGVRGGRITGRAEVQLEGQDSKAELNLRASNVHSTRGEPFDGNTALEVSVRQRSIDGRAEILRIGRRHLLDVLDVVDPTRTDPSINKVRRVLAIAYPDHVRLEFKRGFASAKVEFGGLGRLIKLDEIRGIPMGPIIDRALGPVLENEEK